jgi:hypothetical protein
MLTRTVLIFVLLLGACKGDKKHGPEYTPATANQLKSLAENCEVKAAKGASGRTKELRLCNGRQAMMTIHLDDERYMLEIEIGIWAPVQEEAKALLEQTMKRIVSDKALAAMSERLGNTESKPIVVDGVRVNAFKTQQPNENPRYTAVFSW